MSITIRPGYLVSLKSTVNGGVTYQRVDLVTGEKLQGGAERSEWKTEKLVEDPDELDRAEKCRAKARGLIAKVCTNTAFGLLCPEAREGELDAAIVEARAMTDAFNRDPANKCTQVTVFALKGHVSSDDAEAMRSISSEMSDLVAQMDEGIKTFNAEKIRDAANAARRMSTMLSDDAKAKIDGAIEQARKAARMIVKRIETEGEDRAIVLADIQRGQIQSARIAFLDLSGESAPVEPLPAVSAQRFADLDFAEGSEPMPGMTREEALTDAKRTRIMIDELNEDAVSEVK